MVDVPEAIAWLLPNDPERRRRALVEGIVIGAYTQGAISRGRAGELLGLNYWEGEKFFSSRGVFMNYDLGELRHDLGLSAGCCDEV